MLEIVYSADYLSYDFGAMHPFSPDRWEALEELLCLQGPEASWIEPAGVGDADLLRIHTVSYLEAIHAASAGFPGTHAAEFGLNSQDVPVFFGMHEAAAAVCGGTVLAAQRIAHGQATRVLQLGGGLHHAMPARASGFCIYNDVALAVHALREHGLRVAYVDIDVHHGDGVQSIFYDDPDVLTISLHEDPRFLFPGTGFVSERGRGEGLGTAVNLPLYPGTEDAGWLEAFDQVVPDVLAAFAPDVMVVEAGADAHFMDPLASLMLTTHGFAAAIDRLVELADRLAGGRLLATLGGGYNFDSTLRQWFILGCRLSGAPMPESIDADWRKRWESSRGVNLSTAVHDGKQPEVDKRMAERAQEGNARMLAEWQRLRG